MRTILLADAGPLITLAYAEALDVLFKPGWQVKIVDMVLHEVTRNQTPTSQEIATWVGRHHLAVLETRTFRFYQQARSSELNPRKSNLGEMAIQESMQMLALEQPEST